MIFCLQFWAVCLLSSLGATEEKDETFEIETDEKNEDSVMEWLRNTKNDTVS